MILIVQLLQFGKNKFISNDANALGISSSIYDPATQSISVWASVDSSLYFFSLGRNDASIKGRIHLNYVWSVPPLEVYSSPLLINDYIYILSFWSSTIIHKYNKVNDSFSTIIQTNSNYFFRYTFMVNNVPHLYGDDTSYNILIKRLVYGDIEIFFSKVIANYLDGTSTYTYTWTTTSGYSQLPTDVSIENDDLSTINVKSYSNIMEL